MIRNNSFVITSLLSWSRNEAGNAQSLAIEISKDNRVLYVNPPLDMVSLLENNNTATEHKNRVLRGRDRALTRINRNLWVLEPPIIMPSLSKFYSDAMFDALNRRNNHRYADVISWAMDIIGLETPFFINDNDLFRCFYMDEFLRPLLSIYYRRSNFNSFNSLRQYGKRLDTELVCKSDMIVTPNNVLAEEVRGLNYNTFNIGQGVDLSNYSTAIVHNKPYELQNMRSPIIGYVGTLGVLTVSPNLIYQVARRYPHASIILIGGEDKVFLHHALHRLSNVFFIGEKSDQELPQYISNFDLCINPEPRNEFTNSSYQKQIASYLAMGKSVVATATESMFVFNSYVLLAGDDLHFMELVGAALSEGTIEQQSIRREKFAHSMTWTSCTDRLYTAIEMVGEELLDDPTLCIHENNLTYS